MKDYTDSISNKSGIRTSAAIDKIAPALREIQHDLENPKHNAINPFHKNKYVTLDKITELVRPIANGHKCFITCGTNGGNHIVVRLTHDSGQYIEADGLKLINSKGDAQGEKAAATYATRQSLENFFAIAETGADDDGNEASNIPNKAKQANSAALNVKPLVTGRKKLDRLSSNQKYKIENELGLRALSENDLFEWLKINLFVETDSLDKLTKKTASDSIEAIMNGKVKPASQSKEKPPIWVEDDVPF